MARVVLVLVFLLVIWTHCEEYALAAAPPPPTTSPDATPHIDLTKGNNSRIVAIANAEKDKIMARYKSMTKAMNSYKEGGVPPVEFPVNGEA
ncbi:Uncharacterized protein PBTT_00306 [Plasmodiophora brassicae]